MKKKKPNLLSRGFDPLQIKNYMLLKIIGLQLMDLFVFIRFNNENCFSSLDLISIIMIFLDHRCRKLKVFLMFIS